MTAKNHHAGIQRGDLREAIGLLTRLPVARDATRGAQAAWAWPVAGALVGFIAAVAATVSLLVGLSVPVAAGVALATQIVLTGALHEDGLADCADGLWGGQDQAARLEIMKDSRIGVYGVMALVMATGLRWLLLAELFSAGSVFAALIATAALSRVPMVALAHWLPAARQGGLSVRVGRPSQDTLVLAAAAGLLIAVLVSGFAALPATVTALILSWLVAKISLAKIAGQTGDVLGASQQITEIGVLMTLVVLIA